MADESRALLRIKGLIVRLGVSLELGPFDFVLRRGEVVCLTGKSGSGKTTLLRAIAGLDEPHKGQVLLEGQSARAMGWPMYRRRVVYVHQAPALIDASVDANLARAFSYASARGAYQRDDGVQAIERMNLDANPIDRNARSLSQGEQIRVCLARALLVRPDVLLLDEPTSSLDAENVECVERAIAEFVSSGAAALIATHDTGLAARMNAQTLPITKAGA